MVVVTFEKDERACPACSEVSSAATARKDCGVGVVTVEVEEETQSHLIICPQYQHLRQGLDMYRLEDMIKYFQAVLKERDKKS